MRRFGYLAMIGLLACAGTTPAAPDNENKPRASISRVDKALTRIAGTPNYKLKLSIQIAQKKAFAALMEVWVEVTDKAGKKHYGVGKLRGVKFDDDPKASHTAMFFAAVWPYEATLEDMADPHVTATMARLYYSTGDKTKPILLGEKLSGPDLSKLAETAADTFTLKLGKIIYWH